MRDHKRISVSILSIVILLSLFMPWMTVTCEGQEIATLSGVNAIVGAEIEGEETGNIWEVAIVAVLALVGLAGIVLPLAVRVVISAGGLASLVFMFIRLRMEIADVGQGAGLTFEFGFWVALLAFLLIGASQFLPLKRDNPATTTPGTREGDG